MGDNSAGNGVEEAVPSVTVTVSAEEGVFSEGAVLSVISVPTSYIEQAVESERDLGQNVAVSYTFDIKVVDAYGNEIQHAEGQNVNVSFRTEEVADTNRWRIGFSNCQLKAGKPCKQSIPRLNCV